MITAQRLLKPGVVYLIAAVGLLIVVFSFFTQLLFSRFHYQTAVELIGQKQLQPAYSALDMALQALPGFSNADLENSDTFRSLVFAKDLQRIDTACGDLFLQRSTNATTTEPFLQEMGQSQKCYQAAVAKNPHDIDAATGLARSTAALERIDQHLLKKEVSSLSALPLFERLLYLRPKGVEAHYLLLRYLHSLGELETMQAVARRFVSIYPQSYYQLKNEPLYSPDVERGVQEGLQIALADERLWTQANRALSDIALQHGHPALAAEYYGRTVLSGRGLNATGDLIRLGELFLKSGEEDKAATHFTAALRESDDQEVVLRRIWQRYRAAKQYKAFLAFCHTIGDDRYRAEVTNLLQAYCLGEMGQYGLARIHLNQVTTRKYQAERYALQASIAGKEHNWDEMVLAGHTATVFDPENAGYHSLLIEALKHQKKMAAAEKAAPRAIEAAPSPNAGLFNTRAGIRLHMKNYRGANEDWQNALRLTPRRPDFYYNLSIVAEKEMNYPSALQYARNALQLAPDNHQYQKKVETLAAQSKW